MPETRATGRASPWPFGLMEPGGSFVIPPESVDVVRAAAYAYGRRHGMTFAVRRAPNGVTRCWRADGARESIAQRAPAGRRAVAAVGATPVRIVDGMRVFADQHGAEFVPLDDLLHATLKSGAVRLALERLGQIAEIHPKGAQRAHYAALLGQIRGALAGDGAEPFANALEPPQAHFAMPVDDDDPI